MCTNRQAGDMADAHHVPFVPPLAKFVAGQELLMLIMRSLWALFWPSLSEWWLAAAADDHDTCSKIPPWKKHPQDQVPATRMQSRRNLHSHCRPGRPGLTQTTRRNPYNTSGAVAIPRQPRKRQPFPDLNCILGGLDTSTPSRCTQASNAQQSRESCHTSNPDI